MKVLKYPITVVLLFLTIGIITDNAFQLSGTAVFSIAIATAIVFVIYYVKAQRQILQSSHFIIAAGLMSFSIGMVSHWLHYGPNNSNHYSHYISSDKIPVIKGIVSERLKPNDYYEKFYFEVKSLNHKPVNGKLLLSVPRDSVHRNISTGDVIIIATYLQPIYKSLNPYQFDYSAYMEKQNIFHQLRLKDNYIKTGQAETFGYYINELRLSLVNSFDVHDFTPEVKNIVNALLLGQRQDMDKETTDNYTNAGVIHILAISGLHFATLFFILNLILNPLKRFNKKGELWHLLLVLGLLWTFAFITGLSASVVRSVVMFSFVGVGRYFNRNSDIFNSIAVSMLVLLIAKPNFLFDVGFQLSYAAVFAIVWLQPLYSRIRKSKYKAVNYLSDTIVISLVAQIGVLPLTLYYFNQFPALFLLANVVVIPLSTVILLLGIVVLVLNYTIPALAILAGKALAWLITVMNLFIEWIASFKGLVFKDIPFPLLLCICLSFSLILMVKWLYIKNYKRTVALLASVVLFQGLYTFTAYNANKSNELIVFNNRKSSLIAVTKPGLTTVYSDDSLAVHNKAIIAYSKELFTPHITHLPVKNLIWFNNSRILIVDSTGVYPNNTKPDIVVFTGSPKINLERTLRELKPKQVIADATNYKSYIYRYKTTCQRLGIPFYATPEKGYYRLAK